MIYYVEISDSKFLDMFYFHCIFNLEKVTFSASEIGHYLTKLRRKSQSTSHIVEEGMKFDGHVC